MLKITQNHGIRPYICYTYTIRRKDIMKKILKLAMCLLTVVGLSACGGASTEKQEAVVKSFFDYLKAGDIEKLSTVCTEDNSDVDDLVSMMASFEEPNIYDNNVKELYEWLRKKKESLSL